MKFQKNTGSTGPWWKSCDQNAESWAHFEKILLRDTKYLLHWSQETICFTKRVLKLTAMIKNKSQKNCFAAKFHLTVLHPASISLPDPRNSKYKGSVFWQFMAVLGLWIKSRSLGTCVTSSQKQWTRPTRNRLLSCRCFPSHLRACVTAQYLSFPKDSCTLHKCC